MWAEGDWIKPKNKAAVTHTWMPRDSKRSQPKFRSFEVISKYLKLYCEYSSLVGMKYLANSQRTWLERILWGLIHCVTVSSLLFIIYLSYHEFVTSPILTFMDTDSFRTTDLNFPGVAVCSVNRISRQSAMDMAIEISKSNVTDLPVDEILSLLRQLGNHYSSEFSMDADRNVEVDQLLRAYYNGDYDMSKIMKTLSPHCSIMLLKCKLHGTFRNCSQLFDFRKTQDGYCCTFNYVRESDDIPVMDKVLEPLTVHKVADLGIEGGLTVVMEPFLEDYFYPILPVVGWKASNERSGTECHLKKVIIFDPCDYPDVTSGGVSEVLAMPRTETFVEVTAVSFFSTRTLLGYPPHKRKCIFPKEILTAHGGTSYTYSDCIVDCKIHDMQKLCGCRPFFFPRRGKKEYAWRLCNNADLECLAKHKIKWWTVYPHDNKEEFNLYEEDALHCHNCYPACDDISYDVLSSKSYMTPGQYRTELLRNFNVTNQAILHMFFSKYGSIRLKQDMAYYWYELMSNIGGTCGVFIGFSLISIVEFLYFVVLMLRDLFCNESAVQNDDNRKKEIQNQQVWTIYWGELVPRSRHTSNHSQFPKHRIRH